MSYHSLEELSAQAKELIVEYVDKCDSLKPKERTQIPAQEMPTQDPLIRRTNLEEVAIGFSEDQARIEAMRCLQCVKKNCVQDCPVNIDIPAFVNKIAHGDFEGAADGRQHALAGADVPCGEHDAAVPGVDGGAYGGVVGDAAWDGGVDVGEHG